MNLSNSYHQIIVGKSYVSLIFAILQKAKSNVDNLVLDDERFEIGDKWNNYIGELEKKAITALGERHGISCLEKIDQFIEPSNTMIFLNDKMIELGASPFSNIKELARKLPECFSASFIDGISKIDPEKFDQEVDIFYQSVLDNVFGVRKGDSSRFPASESELLEPLFKRFMEHLKSDKAITKQLHYILQALYQTILSNMLSQDEIRYLLASILSPRYRVDTERLEDELTFVYKTMGGHTKKARAQEFEIYKNKLEYVLLDSYEGIVRTDQVFLFGHFGKSVPFDYEPGETIYKSIRARCPIEHKFAPRFINKRILFSLSDRMGTDFPHWEVCIDDSNMMNATYVYADYEGSKSSFFHRNASEDLLKSLKSLFPGMNVNDWNSQVQFSEGEDVWLDNSTESLNPRRLKIDSLLGSEVLFQGSKVKKVSYCGPLRARFLGYFGYILNILDS